MLCRYASQAIDEFRSFLLLRQRTVPAKVKAPTELYHRNFLFFTRLHETTIFRAWKSKKSHWAALFSCLSFVHLFLPFYSYTNTKNLILSRKHPAGFRDNTGSFRVCIRVLPASIDFCVIVQRFPCEYPSFRDNNRLLPTSINYQAKEPQNNRSYPH